MVWYYYLQLVVIYNLSIKTQNTPNPSVSALDCQGYFIICVKVYIFRSHIKKIENDKALTVTRFLAVILIYYALAGYDSVVVHFEGFTKICSSISFYRRQLQVMYNIFLSAL